jgi:nicotinamidase-related amidase/tRNA(Arg) A34 adenosine deaminase TadA
MTAQTPQAEDERFLRQAIALAGRARAEGEGPFAALLVRDGLVMHQAMENTVRSSDPTAHAELRLISEHCRTAGRFSLEGYTLYASAEPCPMCAGAIHWARISRVVFSASQEMLQRLSGGRPKPGCVNVLAGYGQAEIVGPLLPEEGLAVFAGYTFAPQAQRAGRRPAARGESATALLIIDVQVGNFDPAAPVWGGDGLLARIGALLARARATQTLAVYVQNCGPAGAVDEPATPGWEIHPAIAPLPGDVLVQKHHPDAFQDTPLQHQLEVRGIGRLVVAGMQTEYCVDTTCRRAYSLGYEVTLVQDAHSTWDSPLLSAAQIIAHHNSVLGGWFARLEKAGEISFAT